ncbi:MAG TPA: prolyl oligopeptidase family serine peptidase [Anaerolineales bacterium]
MTTVAPYGSWKSPITTDLIVNVGTSLLEVALDGDDIYWIEGHPKEAGRYAILRSTPEGTNTECTPPEFYARTTVHEYGGGAFTVADGVIYFANYRDQHLYRQRPGGAPELLTPTEGYRYADLVLDRRRDRLLCVREDHTGDGEAINTIVGVGIHGGDDGRVLAQGNNFYSSPRLSPDGSQLAFLTWNHPNMPWDGCELWVADLKRDGALENLHQVAGSATEPVIQPEWSPDGVLHFVAEASGWWNLYRWNGAAPQALCPMDAEFGRPHWVFGQSTYGFASPTRILCCYSRHGTWHLAWLHTPGGELTDIESAYTEIDHLRVGNGFAVLIAGSPTQPSAVVRLDLETGKMRRVGEASQVTVEPGYFSIPEPITYPTEGGLDAHGFYYPPANQDFTAPPEDLPPLLVISHGGPTGASGTTLEYSIQYWTSRGFAVFDCEYGGSTGYGRGYRERLKGNWGIVDVADCCNGALYLARKGLADRGRLAIRGRSAGGYTTLACLAFRPDVFKAGASHYGLSDLEFFVKGTHKFESWYLSSLVGPYPLRKDLYTRRSPIHFINNISAPLILFQGDEDRVVPPSQAQMMFKALKAKGQPVAFMLFQGEQHGYRRAENIKRSLEAELYFYSRIFGFSLAEPVEPVQIENFKR